jgi:hypothetical protein
LAATSAQAARPTSAIGPKGLSVDSILADENADRKVEAAPIIDDLAFLRRATVDLIGRIPTTQEIAEYEKWPAAERRMKLVDKLLKHPGFADRWTVFLADMLRLRSNADGGAALTAFVHKSLEAGLPYDALCRQLISASGKAGKVPEVGFVLGDNADPMALAGTTTQVFMGVRVACAQCHDHPFDVWTREQFYGLAAYFGKTMRRESELTRAVYTMERDTTTVLWPPEGVVPEKDRKPMKPAFPFDLEKNDMPHIARLVSMRAAKIAELERKEREAANSIDDLLSDAGKKASERAGGKKAEAFDVAGEAKREARNLKVDQDLYRTSQLRQELAELVTSPRNRFFSRALVNRVWNELLGRGFVNPVDDFSENNEPSHPMTLDFLSDEFVAGGYDLRSLVRQIMTSEAYQRAHLYGVANDVRESAEQAFVAAPVRRMLAEVMFDSVVSAGHLFEVKHMPGDNMKTIKQLISVPVKVDSGSLAKALENKQAAAAAMQAKGAMAASGSYDLESAIEVNFDAVLKAEADAPEVDKMTAVSKEELEAQMMMKQGTQRTKYVDQVVEQTIDDNPKFTSAMRMPSPAPPAHFLRIFGQPARDLLGDHRDHSPSMRQALMMLNGRITHEASRVGKMEPIYPLLVGKNADLSAAVKLAYREILTREPAADELADALAIVKEGDTPVDGMTDLRWVLFNCHEFRYLP